MNAKEYAHNHECYKRAEAAGDAEWMRLLKEYALPLQDAIRAAIANVDWLLAYYRQWYKENPSEVQLEIVREKLAGLERERQQLTEIVLA